MVSVEYDLTWYEKISKELPKNARVMFVKNDVDGSYCRAIHQVHEFFDVVVVDGRDRVNCIKQALAKLNESGVILLDDSQREDYKEGIDHTVRPGFKRLDIEGLKPADHGANRTTIFYRSRELLQLIIVLRSGPEHSNTAPLPATQLVDPGAAWQEGRYPQSAEKPRALLPHIDFIKQIRTGALAAAQLPATLSDTTGTFTKPAAW